MQNFLKYLEEEIQRLIILKDRMYICLTYHQERVIKILFIMDNSFTPKKKLLEDTTMEKMEIFKNMDNLLHLTMISAPFNSQWQF